MPERGQGRTVYLGLPAFNESAAISSLFARVRRAKSDLVNRRLAEDLNVIFYDDGSTDGTADSVRESRGDLGVFLLMPPRNGGLGVALQGIIRFFLQTSSEEDVLVIMDCDDTHDPEQIANLLARMDEKDEDVVIASRYRKGARIAGVPLSRQVLSLGFAVLVKAVLPIRGVRDYSCGYRSYAKAPLLEAARNQGFFLQESGFSAMPEILIRLRSQGWRFGEIPLELAYDRRETESKMRAWLNTRRLMQCLVKWRFSSHWRDEVPAAGASVLSEVSVEVLATAASK